MPVLFFAVVFTAMQSCQRAEEAAPPSLLNTKHLDHLYEEVEIDGKQLGAIWIYCEAPDYRHVADYDEGFTCVDDVARALVFYCRQHALRPDTANLEKIRTLGEFVLHMQAENGYFYNFMLPSRQINTTHPNSEAVPAFWSWRAFWALTELAKLDANGMEDVKSRGLEAMRALLRNISGLCASTTGYKYFDGVKVPACIAGLGGDQAGLILLALGNYYEIYPSGEVKDLIMRFGTLLSETQYGKPEMPPYCAFFSWQNYWHAWGNIQAYALLRAGRLLSYQPFVEAALNEVRYFYPYCIAQGLLCEFKAEMYPGDSMRLDIKRFPQIAYGVRPMVYAALEAYDITGDAAFAETAAGLAVWLLGANPAGQSMYDAATGRTYDGIGSESEINRNSGAESTIEALLTLQAIESAPQARQLLTTHYRK